MTSRSRKLNSRKLQLHGYDAVARMSLYNYFKPASVLPPPDGPLSKIVPSSSIQAANEAVQAILPDGTAAAGPKPSKNSKKRGTCMKYSPKEKARIGNYAVQHGTSAALRHYNKDFPNLKWTTVNDWKEAIIKGARYLLIIHEVLVAMDFFFCRGAR